jgi:hypothetical protein
MRTGLPLSASAAIPVMLMAAVLVAGPANAMPGPADRTTAGTTLYRWVDSEGRVTYQDRPPPESAVEVEQREIDADRNVVPAPDLGSAGSMPPEPAPSATAVPRPETPPEPAPEAISEPALSPIERAILIEQWRQQLEEEPTPDTGAPAAPGGSPSPAAPSAPGAEGAPPLQPSPGAPTAPGAQLPVPDPQ